ncbi:MAG TPA: hypothetical protein VMT53_04690 [Terriglobales bacterium]|nr:hypothetical protein [Terriglobales bacterium]
MKRCPETVAAVAHLETLSALGMPLGSLFLRGLLLEAFDLLQVIGVVTGKVSDQVVDRDLGFFLGVIGGFLQIIQTNPSQQAQIVMAVQSVLGDEFSRRSLQIA